MNFVKTIFKCRYKKRTCGVCSCPVMRRAHVSHVQRIRVKKKSHIGHNWTKSWDNTSAQHRFLISPSPQWPCPEAVQVPSRRQWRRRRRRPRTLPPWLFLWWQIHFRFSYSSCWWSSFFIIHFQILDFFFLSQFNRLNLINFKFCKM